MRVLIVSHSTLTITNLDGDGSSKYDNYQFVYQTKVSSLKLVDSIPSIGGTLYVGIDKDWVPLKYFEDRLPDALAMAFLSGLAKDFQVFKSAVAGYSSPRNYDWAIVIEEVLDRHREQSSRFRVAIPSVTP